MHLTHIPTAAQEAATLQAQVTDFFSNPPVLDQTPNTSAVVPLTGGVPGRWISATDGPTVPDNGVTLYLHGGGFRFTKPELELVMAHRLAAATGRPAFVVDYRLLPDHPYPAAIDDVVAVYRSLLSQAVPAERILLAGESAGGTLALSALLALAAAGDVLPAGVVAGSPITDFTAASESLHVNSGNDVISPDIIGPIVDAYLAGARPDAAPQSPLYGDLSGLPPLLLSVGSNEILLDDSRRFGTAAAAAGTDVTLDIYDGLTHLFQVSIVASTVERLPVATTYLENLAKWVNGLG